jgi:MoaA/NifB/PqqE/SkfB family radical SAM enzyme
MLKSAVCFITMLCNYDCPYCWEAQMRREGKFLPEKLRPASDWAEALNRLEPSVLDITGGEPSIMPDFIELLQNLDPSINVAFTSNFSFDVEEFMRRAPIYRIHSITASYHPSKTGVTLESFTEKMLKLRDAYLPVTVNFVAAPSQMKEIPSLKAHFSSHAVRFHVEPYICQGFEYSEEESAFLAPYIEADRTPDAVQGEAYLCSGGLDHISIQPNGDAYRCLLDKQKNDAAKIGNIFDPAFFLLSKMTLCAHRFECPGCDKDKVTVRKVGS